MLFLLDCVRIMIVMDKSCDYRIRHSIVASIPACHAGDQGSIPCDGKYMLFWSFLYHTHSSTK